MGGGGGGIGSYLGLQIVPDAVKFDLFFCSVSTLLSFGILGDDVSTGDIDRSWLAILFLSPGVEPLLRNSNN